LGSIFGALAVLAGLAAGDLVATFNSSWRSPGVVEIELGVGLIAVWRYRVQIGWAVGFFFTAIFWGNISQYVNHVDAFGLNSDKARFIRLLFQPLLVAWALGSTGAWKSFRAKNRL